eukprot:m.65411 g.65411  ORF g.65411 m.65411 type:complete len:883 (-) comp23555_c1_seq1:32-2680(-)
MSNSRITYTPVTFTGTGTPTPSVNREIRQVADDAVIYALVTPKDLRPDPKVEEATRNLSNVAYTSVVFNSEGRTQFSKNIVDDNGSDDPVNYTLVTPGDLTLPPPINKVSTDVPTTAASHVPKSHYTNLSDASVNPNAPPWYHGAITAEAAMHILTAAKPGTFIVRQEADMRFEIVVMEADGLVGHNFVRRDKLYRFIAPKEKLIAAQATVADLVDMVCVPNDKWAVVLTSFVPRATASQASVEAEIERAESLRASEASAPKKMARDLADTLQQIWQTLDCDDEQMVSGAACRAVMERSMLDRTMLGKIWSLVDISNIGYLTYSQFGSILGLISQAQNRTPLNLESASNAPPPVFKPSDMGYQNVDVEIEPPQPRPRTLFLDDAVNLPDAMASTSRQHGASTSSNKDNNTGAQVSARSSKPNNNHQQSSPTPTYDLSSSSPFSTPDGGDATYHTNASANVSSLTTESTNKPLTLIDDNLAYDTTQVSKTISHPAAVESSSANSGNSDELESQPWFAGKTDKAVVDRMAAIGNQGDFLVRESSKGKSHLVLVIQDSGQVLNFNILVDSLGKCQLGKVKVDSVVKLIEALHKKPLISPLTSKPLKLNEPMNPTLNSHYEHVVLEEPSYKEDTYVEIMPFTASDKVAVWWQGMRRILPLAKRGGKGSTKVSTEWGKSTLRASSRSNSGTSLMPSPKSKSHGGDRGTQPIHGSDEQDYNVDSAKVSSMVDGNNFKTVLTKIEASETRWLNPQASKNELESELACRVDGSFMARKSMSQQNCWVVSVKKMNGGVWNGLVKETRQGFVIHGVDTMYASLAVLLARCATDQTLCDKIGLPGQLKIPLINEPDDGFDGLRKLVQLLDKKIMPHSQLLLGSGTDLPSDSAA